ncbi:hypothetical protein DFA_11826 [Cavenderia fasciculata]|uniref:GSKIP domain-containing protein n=1 Tax=Cavenderia fasciculata TaxID=261658 RepID=F4QEB6_CACFS|nr:uncharacterized protein DFA_11826 [Cavenderia fasciculata]EGG14063.1 hypothetical protein DFA_11826 [Cavenderia fasciculata]|eukprot:XP_004350771.1 hypothetical protein DFA_11826 [Cavenderia fasciculata]
MSIDFKKEIEAAIEDVSYGVKELKVLDKDPRSDVDGGVVLFNIECHEPLSILIRMSMHEGFSLIELKGELDQESSAKQDQSRSSPCTPPVFDSLPNIVMYYSHSFQQKFNELLFSKLAGLNR